MRLRKAIPWAAVAILAVVVSIAGWASKSAGKPSPWKAIGQDEIWAVAWSPKGSHIAFVAVNEGGGDIAVEGSTVSHASVWVMKNPGTSGKVELRKVATRTVEQGIPVGLFWFSEDEIGWAASAHYPRGFTICSVSLSSGKVRQVINRRFDLHYVEHAGSEPYDGPYDIYYDRASRSLFFTGDNDTEYVDGSPPVYIGRFRLSDSKLELRKVTAWTWPDVCTFTGSDGKTKVYVTETGSRPEEADASNLSKWRSAEMKIDNLDLSAMQVLDMPIEEDEEAVPVVQLAISVFGWPNAGRMSKVVAGGRSVRISPDGKTISWLESKSMRDSLVLYDLAKKTRVVAAKWVNCCWFGPLGCPYSWSPTGNSIAYSDGTQIYIVAAHRKR